MKLTGKRVSTIFCILPTNKQTRLEDDTSTSSEDSSIVARVEIVSSNHDDSSKLLMPTTNYVSASLQDIGRCHSRMDVHGCLDTTCVFCASRDGVSFIPRYSSDVETLQKVMWSICGAEQDASIPTHVRIKRKDKRIRCNCGRASCDLSFEI